MYFLLHVLFVIYIHGVSTDLVGTQYHLNYRVYFENVHPIIQLGEDYILGLINISLPGPHIGFEAVKDPCKVTLESAHSRASHHHTCQTFDMLTQQLNNIRQQLNNIRQSIVKKLNSTMASIEMIIGTTPINTAVDLQSKNRTCRTLSGMLPFIGEISKVLFGTATENDVRQQQLGVNQALTLANLNAKELNYLGSVSKKAIVIH